MSLAEKLAEVNAPPPCRISTLVASLPKPDGKALIEAIDDEGFGVQTIVRIVRGEGMSITTVAVKAHRRRECGCER